MDKVLHTLCRLENLRFVRVLHTKDRIVRSNTQFIHSLLAEAESTGRRLAQECPTSHASPYAHRDLVVQSTLLAAMGYPDLHLAPANRPTRAFPTGQLHAATVPTLKNGSSRTMQSFDETLGQSFRE